MPTRAESFGRAGCSLSFDIASRIARPARAARSGIVVVRLGPAEIGHHAVAKVLGDMAAEALDCLRRRAMVLGDDLPPLLGIEMAGDLGRADQIAEKHRQMPPLAFGHFAWFAVFDNDGCGSALGRLWRAVGCRERHRSRRRSSPRAGSQSRTSGKCTASAAPHRMQNFLPAAFSKLQLEQRICLPTAK